MPRAFSRRISASIVACDSRMPRSSSAVRAIECGDVVPGTHGISAVERHRPDRCMRKDEAQRPLSRAHQLGYDRLEVMAVGAQAVQPDNGGHGVAAGFNFYCVIRHDALPGHIRPSHMLVQARRGVHRGTASGGVAGEPRRTGGRGPSVPGRPAQPGAARRPPRSPAALTAPRLASVPGVRGDSAPSPPISSTRSSASRRELFFPVSGVLVQDPD